MSIERVPVRCVFRTDGEVEMLEGPQTMAQIEALINCETCHTTLLSDRMHVMIVDDAGYARGLPINKQATLLYMHGRAGDPWMIRGDAVVVPDSDFAMPNGEPFRSRPL
jgi:hypothetical protein